MSISFLAPFAPVLVKATAIFAITLGAVRIGARLSASVRHLLLVGGTTVALTLPIASLVLPEWRLPILPASNELVSESIIPQRSFTLAAPLPITSNTTVSARVQTQLPAVSSALPQSSLALSHGNRLASGSDDKATQTVVMFWACGALLALLPWLIAVVRRRRLEARASSALSANWELECAHLVANNTLTARTRVLVSAEVQVPLSWGVLRAVILLPHAADWTTAERRAALLHELAHIERRDSVTQLLMRVVVACYWFHPLAWLTMRQELLAREEACDDAVLNAGARASDYAAQLIRVANTAHTRGAGAAALAMATRSSLAERLVAILDATRSRATLSWQTRAAATAGAMVVLLAAGSVNPVRATTTQATGFQPVARSATSDPQTSVSATAFAPSATRERSAMLPAARLTAPATLDEIDSGGRNAAIDNTITLVDELPDTPDSAIPTPLPAATAVVPASNSPAIALPVLPLRAAQQYPCTRGDQRGSSSTSYHIDDDRSDARLIVKWKSNGCTLEVDARGSYTLSDAGDDVVKLSSRGHFNVSSDDGKTERELRMTPAGAAGVEREYKVDGRRKEWDAEGAQWLAKVLITLDRRTGFAVDSRLPYILKTGGVQGVLDEMTLIESDFAVRKYFTGLAKRAELSGAQLRSVIGMFDHKNKSDYEMTELLLVAVGQRGFDEATQLAATTVVGDMTSDYERRRSLMALLSRDNQSENALAAMLKATRGMDSDYELAELLIAVSSRYAVSPTTRDFYFDALNSVESDYEHRRTLSGMLKIAKADTALIVRMLRDSQRISSDYEHATILVEIAQKFAMQGTLRDEFARSAQGIGSEYERSRALAAAFRGSAK